MFLSWLGGIVTFNWVTNCSPYFDEIRFPDVKPEQDILVICPTHAPIFCTPHFISLKVDYCVSQHALKQMVCLLSSSKHLTFPIHYFLQELSKFPVVAKAHVTIVIVLVDDDITIKGKTSIFVLEIINLVSWSAPERR